MQAVKVKYNIKGLENDEGYLEYTYFSEDKLAVDDEVMVPVGKDNRMCPAIVTQVNVPSDDHSSMYKIKTIPAGSRIVAGSNNVNFISKQTKSLKVSYPPSEADVIQEIKQELDPHDLRAQLDDNAVAIVRVAPSKDAEVRRLYGQALRILAVAREREIKNLDDLKPANDDLITIRALRKAIEEKRKEWTSPLRSRLDDVNAAFRAFTEPLEQADKLTTDKMRVFNQELERRRKQEDEENQRRLEAAQEEAAENDGEIQEPVGLTADEPGAQKRVSTAVGTSGWVDKWQARVVDPEKLPREYMMPDMAMLQAIAKKHHDQKPVPGVKFYNEPYMRTAGRK